MSLDGSPSAKLKRIAGSSSRFTASNLSAARLLSSFLCSALLEGSLDDLNESASLSLSSSWSSSWGKAILHLSRQRCLTTGHTVLTWSANSKFHLSYVCRRGNFHVSSQLLQAALFWSYAQQAPLWAFCNADLPLSLRPCHGRPISVRERC